MFAQRDGSKERLSVMALRGVLLFPLEQACMGHLGFQCTCGIELAGLVYKKGTAH
jgi:hypothetical protein